MNFKYSALGLLVMAGPLLAGDTYQIDPAHTTVGFAVEHLVISKVAGRFKDVTGTLEVDLEAKPVVRFAAATIQAASIDTGIEKRDEHLRGTDFFDVAKFPELTFVSKKVAAKDGKNYITGTLTIHGVSREVTALFTIKGPVKDPWGKMRIGLHASGTIDRKDYGLTWNKTLETGGLVVGDEVEIDLQVEAIKTDAAKQ